MNKKRTKRAKKDKKRQKKDKQGQIRTKNLKLQKFASVILCYFLFRSHKGTSIPCEYSLTQIVVIVTIIVVSYYTDMVSRCLYGNEIRNKKI